MITVVRNLLGVKARKVLGVVSALDYVKLGTQASLQSDYSCSYSRAQTPLELQPVAIDIAGCVGREPHKVFVYRMVEGDHFKRHQDSGDHAVYYLTEDWEEDWGGVLEADGGEKFVPELDAVAVVSSFHPHWVTPVTGKAKHPRYTILVQC